MKWCLTIWVCVGVSLFAGCRDKSVPSSHSGKNPAATAEVVPVLRRNVAWEIRAPVSLESYYQTRISAKLPAYVDTVAVDIGDEVSRGTMLVQLRAGELVERRAQAEQRLLEAEQVARQRQAMIASAEAMVREADAARAAAVALAGQRQTEAKRMAQLVAFGSLQQAREEESRFALQAAQAALRQAESAMATARSKLTEAREHFRSAQANVAVKRAALAEARAMEEYLQLRSPYQGIVTMRSASPGQLVRPVSDGGEPLLVVEQVDPLRVVVFLPLRDATHLDVGDAITLTTMPRMPKLRKQLKIKRVARAFDRGSRMMRAEAELPNPVRDGARVFRPGDYGKATLTLHVFENAITVPPTAVVASAEETYVMKVDEGRTCRRVAVRVLYRTETAAVVEPLHGKLSERDTVIKKQAQEFHDGQQLDTVTKLER